MGKVWLAMHLTLGVRCAVTFMTSEAMGHPEYAARFALEARAIAHLNSPNIVRVLDYDVDDGVPFIAMEWLQGEDLGARIRRAGRLDPAVTYRILSHGARGLEKAHAAGIVHRDLKPENIFLAEEDEGEIAKLLDFGIATRISCDSGGGVTRAPNAGVELARHARVHESRTGGRCRGRSPGGPLVVGGGRLRMPDGPAPVSSRFARRPVRRDPARAAPRAQPGRPGAVRPSSIDGGHRAASRSLPDRFATASALAHALARALGVLEPSPEATGLPARPLMRRSGLVAASLSPGRSCRWPECSSANASR